MELTLEEKRQWVKDLRPIDDVCFEVLASDKAVCQEILRVIMEDDDLIVEDVVVQSSERNLYGRGVRLDALCRLKTGALVNIEVQRADNDDHLRRARFNAASITTRESQTGDDFSKVVELYIVYISEFDFLKLGKTTYHIEKVIRETGTVIDDGLHEIFINTAVYDGSRIADLMSCFTKRIVNDQRFPVLSRSMYELKETEGGLSAMCSVMEHYSGIARAEGRKIGIAEGMKAGLAEGKKAGLAEGKKAGLAEGKKAGLAEGKKAGLAEGELSKAQDMAMLLYQGGMSLADIARIAKYPEETVAKWIHV